MSAKLVCLKSVIRASEETIKELEALLDEAKAGTLTGIAYVAVHQGSDYSLNARGAARLCPVYTLGMLRSLEHLITSLI